MIIPLHPQPYDDELLSSWILRVATQNGVYLHVLYKVILGIDPSVSVRDIDRLDRSEVISIMSEYLGVGCDVIRSLTISSFEGDIFENAYSGGFTKWVLPLGKYHRFHKLKGIVYCPQCLAEDKEVYFRKIWRLSFVTICPKHGCLLRDSCPSCGSVIDYQRIGVGGKVFDAPFQNIGICPFCGYPLWKCDLTPIPSYLRAYIGLYLSFIKNFIEGGSCLPSLNQPFRLQEFNGLWALIASFQGRRSKGVISNIHKILGFSFESDKSLFDRKDLLTRLKILIVVFWLLDDWPHRLHLLAADTKYSFSVFSDFNDKLPYWLYSVVRRELFRSKYIPTDQEIISLSNYLNRNSIDTSPELYSRLLNIHIGTCRMRLRSLDIID